jgi:hypothetical protein
MTDHSTIQYISGLLDKPGSIDLATDGPKIKALVREYPYMAPLRYLDAAIGHKEGIANNTILDAMQPYMGNWLMYCDMVDAVNGIVHPIRESGKESEIEEVAPVEEILTMPTPQPEPVVEAGFVAYNTEEVFVEEKPSEAKPEAEAHHPTPQEEMQQVQHAHIEAAIHEAEDAISGDGVSTEPLIMPVYTDDYFLQQGVKVPDEIPQQIEDLKQAEKAGGGLMVMMSFSEWLLHFKHTSQKEKEEDEEQRALKAMWQKEKLTAAMEEENEEIPENVFEMAVNSIAKEEDLASEPLANIYIKQGKYEKALDMYRKLSLRNPQKSAYFAQKIEEILKEKQS